MKRRRAASGLAALALAAGLVLAPPAQPAHAFIGSLIAGVGDLIEGAFALPVHIISGTLSGPPLIGTLGGVMTGALQMVASTTRGAFRIATFALPAAWKVAPFLPFVL